MITNAITHFNYFSFKYFSSSSSDSNLFRHYFLYYNRYCAEASQNFEFRKSMGIITKFHRLPKSDKLTRNDSSQDLKYNMKKKKNAFHEKESCDNGDSKYVPYQNKSNLNKKKVKTKVKIQIELENKNPNKKNEKIKEISAKTDTSDIDEGCSFNDEDKSKSQDTKANSEPSSPSESCDEEYYSKRFRETSSRNSFENAYSLPPSDVLDSFVRLDQIAMTLQNLSDNLSRNLRNEGNSDNRMFPTKPYKSIVFPNKSVAPYDFMGDSKTCSQDFEFDGMRGFGSPSRMPSIASYFLDKELIDSRCSRNSERNSVSGRMSYAQFDNRVDHSGGYSPIIAKNRIDLDYLSHHYDDKIEVEGDSSELRAAIEKAGEHASGLSAVAAKYGIYN